MTEIFGIAGKIPTTYRESSRWISVKNIADVPIPPYAPCYFVMGTEENQRDDKLMLVAPYIGRKDMQIDRGIKDPLNLFYSDTAYSLAIAFNGATPIKGKGGHGLVTSDYPVVARVTIDGRSYPTDDTLMDAEQDLEVGEDPDVEVDPVVDPDAEQASKKKVGHRDTFYIDQLSTPFGDPVPQLSNLGFHGLDYTEGDPAAYLNLASKFAAVAVANEDAKLFWVVPVSKPRFPMFHTRKVSGSVSGQELVEPIPLSGLSAEKYSWGGVDADGAIVFKLPGVYMFRVRMDAGSTSDDNQDEMGTLTHVAQLEAESLSDFYVEPDENFYSGGMSVTSELTIEQPSFLRRINCSGGYGSCPKMDTYRPRKTIFLTLGFQVSVTHKWQPPEVGKEAEAEPLARVKATRMTNFDVTQNLSSLGIYAAITRMGFGDAFFEFGGTTGAASPGFFTQFNMWRMSTYRWGGVWR